MVALVRLRLLPKPGETTDEQLFTKLVLAGGQPAILSSLETVKSRLHANAGLSAEEEITLWEPDGTDYVGVELITLATLLAEVGDSKVGLADAFSAVEDNMVTLMFARGPRAARAGASAGGEGTPTRASGGTGGSASSPQRRASGTHPSGTYRYLPDCRR